MSGKKFFSLSPSKAISEIEESHLLPDLGDADIYVFGIGRAGTLGRKPLDQKALNHILEFWNAYFSKAGAKTISINESLTLYD